jgi:hypothetical protein
VAQLWTNNAFSTLLNPIASGDGTLTVASGDGSKFPSPSGGDYFDVTLTQAGQSETSWEVARCTSRSGDVLTVTRHVEGVTAAWAALDKVELRITAAFLASVGNIGIPLVSQSANATFALSHAGGGFLHPSADTTARTFTIDANGTVAFPINTALTIVNQNGAGVVTIAITTDTMRIAGAGTTGSRTLAANGIATAIKLTATEWIINGTGLT